MSTTRLATARTLDDLLQWLGPALPKEISAEGQLDAAHAIASLFASQLSGFIGLEFRILNPREGVDFMFCVGKTQPERQAFADFCSALPAALSFSQEWRRIGAFAQVWADQTTLIAQLVQDIWLEFDLPMGEPGAVVPSIFFEIRDAATDPLRTGRVLKQVLSLLCGQDVELGAATLRCISSLPAKTLGLIFGALLPRRTDFLRICVQGLNERSAIAYLESVGWTGTYGHIEPSLRKLSPLVDYLTLNLDVAQTVRHRIGIEYMFHGRTQPGGSRTWDRVFAALHELGLCESGIGDALCKFAARPSAGSGEGWHRLNHVKVVHAAPSPAQAKCYLFARQSEVGAACPN